MTEFWEFLRGILGAKDNYETIFYLIPFFLRFYLNCLLLGGIIGIVLFKIWDFFLDSYEEYITITVFMFISYPVTFGFALDFKEKFTYLSEMNFWLFYSLFFSFYLLFFL